MTPAESSAHVLAIGGAHVDRRGQISGVFVPGASNPGVLHEEVGGGVFNALRNIARRGGRASIMSLRGGDTAGDAVARAIAEAGIEDLSAVFLDRSTPTYTAFLDREGELLAGLADMALYDLAFMKQLGRSKAREAIARADAVLCDANLPESALRRLAELSTGKDLFAIGISPAKAVRLKPILGALSCLFLNRREAAAMTGARADADPFAAVALLREMGLRRAVITANAGTIVAFDEDATYEADPPEPAAVVDVTGAGDALAGATILALVGGARFPAALRHGMAAAKLCIECAASVPDHGEPGFSDALAVVPDVRRVA